MSVPSADAYPVFGRWRKLTREHDPGHYKLGETTITNDWGWASWE